MSSVSFKSARRFINIILFTMCSFGTLRVKAFEIDFSRRQLEMSETRDESRLPASVEIRKENLSLVETVFDPSLPAEDVVIMQTESGFVPASLRLKRDGKYRIHIVNVNEKSKNVSFVLDSFSEFHSTVFGVEKSFIITPKKEGIYTFISPETSARGQLVIYSPEEGRRRLASDSK